MSSVDANRIVFMGTPLFAAKHLEALVLSSFNVVGVFSQEDKVSSRGNKKSSTPVKSMAKKYSIPVFQPKSVNVNEGFELLKSLSPDIIVVVAFGKILKRSVIDLPKKGIFNVHASLLPKYRGAAPIHRAIENGESKSGVCIMKIDEGLDTGDIALMREISIDVNDSYDIVEDSIAQAGCGALIDFLNLLNLRKINFVKQSADSVSYASKIDKDELFVDWNAQAFCVHNKIRALDSCLGARSFLNGEVVKLFSSRYVDEVSYSFDKAGLGEIVSIRKNTAWVKVQNGIVCFEKIQFPNKKVVSVSDAKNGNKLTEGMIFKNNA